MRLTPIRLPYIQEALNLNAMIESMMSDEAELISVYYGADIEEAAAEAVVSKIEEKFPDVDVELQFGGQPVYYYIVSVE